MKAILPNHIMAAIYLEIEKILSRMDLPGLPFDELVILAKGIKNRVIEQNHEAVRQALYEYFINLSRKELKECLKHMYNDYMMDGGELSYRNFIISNASRFPPEKREQFLSMIDL
jgi:hypothetical protein